MSLVRGNDSRRAVEQLARIAIQQTMAKPGRGAAQEGHAA
jgi:hypothetical protein